MKKLKILALLLAVSMSAFTVVGCSQNGDKKNDNGNNSNITDIDFNREHITIRIDFQNFRYEFCGIPHNENGKISIKDINCVYGSRDYPKLESCNPTDEEFLELFEKLDLLSIDLPDHGYIVESPSNYFGTLCPEDTWLYFN